MVIQGKLLSYGADITEALEIRRQVFIKEFHHNEEQEFDEMDSYAIHVIVYEQSEGKRPVATGRIDFDGTSCEISHVAVLKEYRNKRYGDFTVRMLINKAFTSGIRDVYAEVPIDLIPFFQKIGFKVIDNESKDFQEKTIRMLVRDGELPTCCSKK